MLSRLVYDHVVAIVFSFVAVMHLLRVFNGWPAEIGGWTVPLWLSWLALALAGYLACHAWRYAMKGHK